VPDHNAVRVRPVNRPGASGNLAVQFAVWPGGGPGGPRHDAAGEGRNWSDLRAPRRSEGISWHGPGRGGDLPKDPVRIAKGW
jgi:hypothetical protein